MPLGVPNCPSCAGLVITHGSPLLFALTDGVVHRVPSLWLAMRAQGIVERQGCNEGESVHLALHGWAEWCARGIEYNRKHATAPTEEPVSDATGPERANPSPDSGPRPVPTDIPRCSICRRDDCHQRHASE